MQCYRCSDQVIKMNECLEGRWGEIYLLLMLSFFRYIWNRDSCERWEGGISHILLVIPYEMLFGWSALNVSSIPFSIHFIGLILYPELFRFIDFFLIVIVFVRRDRGWIFIIFETIIFIIAIATLCRWKQLIS